MLNRLMRLSILKKRPFFRKDGTISGRKFKESIDFSPLVRTAWLSTSFHNTRSRQAFVNFPYGAFVQVQTSSDFTEVQFFLVTEFQD
jgi:hypothetical protein